MLAVAVAMGCVGNMVQMLYVPPNEVVLTGSLFLASEHTPVAFVGNLTKDSVCTMPASVVLGSHSVARMAPSVVADYVYLHYQRDLHRLTCVLTHSTGSSPTREATAQMQLSVSDLATDVSTVFGFYRRSLLYFGPIPESYASHMINLGNLTLTGTPDDLSAIPMRTVNGTTMTLSAAHWDHELTATECGRVWTILPGLTFAKACTGEEPPNGTSIVSLRSLGAGVHVQSNANTVTVYVPNETEFDPVTAWAFIAVLMLYLGVWLMWTREMPDYIHSDEACERVWVEITVNGAPITVAVLMMILSRTMWAAVQKSHGMYNIETIDMITLAYLDVYVQLYAFVFTPIMVGVSLLIVAYGNAMYSAPPVHTDAVFPRALIRQGARWLSWNSDTIQSYTTKARVALFALAYAVAVTLVLLFWSVTYQSTESAVLSTVYVTLVLVYLSSSARMHELLYPLFEVMSSHDKTLLAFLAWAMRVLILTCVPANTPYSIDQAFTLQFHTFIVMGAGAKVADVTGSVVTMLRDLGCAEDVLLFMPLGLFAVSFAILFGFGSLWGSTGALRGEGHTTLVCSVTLGYFVTVGRDISKSVARLPPSLSDFHSRFPTFTLTFRLPPSLSESLFQIVPWLSGTKPTRR